MSTTLRYDHRYLIPELELSAIIIIAFLSCNDRTPQAYVFFISPESPPGPIIQLCSGSNNPFTNVTITWDGTTVDNASGFTVVRNGNRMVARTDPPINENCSSMPNGGVSVTCRPAANPLPIDTGNGNAGVRSFWDRYKNLIIIGIVFLILLIIILIVIGLLRRR